MHERAGHSRLRTAAFLAYTLAVVVLAMAMLFTDVEHSSAETPPPNPPDPSITLNAVFDALIAAPKLTMTTTAEGGDARLSTVINKPKRFIFQRGKFGSTRVVRLQTKRLAFNLEKKPRCWRKYRHRMDAREEFRGIKAGIKDVVQSAADTLTYSQVEDGETTTFVLRYDPATLRPSLLDATPLNDGDPTSLAFPATTTFVFRASDRMPKHRPLCKRSKPKKKTKSAPSDPDRVELG